MTQDVTQIFGELDTLLDEERSALLGGELEQIAALMARKIELIEQLESLEEADREQLSGLHTKATRNQELLDGSLRGIRAVANRLSDLRKLRREMETYDQKGQKNVIPGTPARKLERRA
ncbi:hypothetical protein SAMN05421688_2607 [Poseidonocella pacifica]|uniref:FlgN protein n=1 Tax=Poseidonocella pacifica TaxID=871651 RepID=A0A1I0XWZ5_9RHOB|nr:hypothetical protein [Poseidonocella pacifica]SFB05532.1 hypothetical protein SAMN05421688_2607 [Poseidonocella pacifica]